MGFQRRICDSYLTRTKSHIKARNTFAPKRSLAREKILVSRRDLSPERRLIPRNSRQQRTSMCRNIQEVQVRPTRLRESMFTAAARAAPGPRTTTSLCSSQTGLLDPCLLSCLGICGCLGSLLWLLLMSRNRLVPGSHHDHP